MTDTANLLLAYIILGLGTARITALIVLDEITHPVRDMIFHWYPPEDDDANGMYYQSLRPATNPERYTMDDYPIAWWKKRWSYSNVPRDSSFLGRMLVCYKCTSIWIAGLNMVSWLLFPHATLLLNGLFVIAIVSMWTIKKGY